MALFSLTKKAVTAKNSGRKEEGGEEREGGEEERREEERIGRGQGRWVVGGGWCVRACVCVCVFVCVVRCCVFPLPLGGGAVPCCSPPDKIQLV